MARRASRREKTTETTEVVDVNGHVVLLAWAGQCGDCGGYTCEDCRVIGDNDPATRCNNCRAKHDAQQAPDITVEDHGSIVLLRPVSVEGQEWIERNVDTGPESQWWGSGTTAALVVEPRYVADIVTGAQADGLVVRRG